MRISILGDINSSHTRKWLLALLDKHFEVQCISINPSESSFEHPKLKLVNLGVDRSVSKGASAITKWSYLLKIKTVRKALCDFQADHVHAHFASSYGLLALLSSRPYFISLWGSDILNFPNRNIFFRAILGRVVKHAKKVFATSNYMANRCEQLYGVRPIVIPFGINVAEFSTTKQAKPTSTIITIGTVKALEKTYGIDVLIRAFALALKDGQQSLRLVIIGDGTYMNEYKQLAKDLNVESFIQFTGRIAHEKVAEALHGFDIFANLSRQESFGVSILEASASALPVLVSNIEGLKEVYIESETGLSVDINDLEDVKLKIIELASNENERLRLGQNGQRFVEKNFDWSKCVERQVSYYLS